MHRATLGPLLPHPGDELLPGKLPGRPDQASPALDRYRDIAQIHVQSQLPHLCGHCAIATAARFDKFVPVMKG
jgi:hypothetical protein